MFSISQQKAPAAAMYYASAYAPPVNPHACPTDVQSCPAPGDHAVEGPYCSDAARDQLVENFQADMQRHVNDIKRGHIRWAPGRFREARRNMLEIAMTSGEENLPPRTILTPLWPPVPRTKDAVKAPGRLDVHGHVLAIKMWAKAVLFACRYSRDLSLGQKKTLCRAAESLTQEAAQSVPSVSNYDRWRLAATTEHLVKMRQQLRAKSRAAGPPPKNPG